MKNKKRMITLIIILAVAVLFGLRIGGNLQNKRSSKINPSQSFAEDSIKATPITIARVKKEKIDDTIFTIGEVSPTTKYNVNSKLNGEVDKIYFKVGDTVKKDDLLFTMKSDVYSSDKNSNLSKLKNQLDIAKTSLSQAKKSFDDTKKLFELGASSKDQLDRASLNYDNSNANYKNALSSYNSLKVSYSNQNDLYKVKSPVDGIITTKNIEEGMFASQSNGFTIITNKSLLIKSKISSKYINSIKVDQEVDIYINTIDRNYKGFVSSISYSAVKGSYPIEVTIIKPDEFIYSGMYGELKVKLTTKENVLTVPLNSIVKENNDSYVYKIINDTAIKTTIKTGIINNNFVEVSGNIKTNDKVALKGKEFLKDNSKVMIQ